MPTDIELQRHLLKSLPDYMVPSAFFQLDAVPLSTNGKLDLSRLEQCTSRRVQETVAVVVRAPASSVEEKVLAMVRGLLKNNEVGTGDNFFLAGGHSLLATQLLLRLRREFGIDVTLRQLFESPTVEDLAELVEKLLRLPRLAQVWAEILGRSEVPFDDNFFALGGELELLPALQRRIAVQFGRQIPIDQLAANPTVREQAEMMSVAPETQPTLPPGVIALQPKGAGPSFFWMHYIHLGLSNAAGEDQPFLVVRVMAEDFPSLGENPSLETIAACHTNKILSTQRCGPYTVGGICLGAVLAFEVAQQLRSTGNEVSLILLDPPNPSDVNGAKGPKWNQPLYAFKRAARLGVKATLSRVLDRVTRVTPLLKPESSKTEVEIAQRMLTTATAAYEPKRYDGSVLLILPSERAPHLDFLPAWQKVIPNNLHVGYFDGYQDDMTTVDGAQRVAEAIHAHLASEIALRC